MKRFFDLVLAEFPLVRVVVIVESRVTRKYLGVRLLVDQEKRD